MVDHNFHWITLIGEKVDDFPEQAPCAFAIDRRQDDEPGMQFDRAQQGPEVSRILRHDYPVLAKATFDYFVVPLTAPSKVQRMDCLVIAGFVQPTCQKRG